MRGGAGHLNGKVRKVGDLLCLLIADSDLAEWEETQRVENMKREMRVEREAVEKDHVRRVTAESVSGEEKKRLAKREN